MRIVASAPKHGVGALSALVLRKGVTAMKHKGKHRRRRLLHLWEVNQCCHWCKRLTLLIFRGSLTNKNPLAYLPNEAVMDHLYSRLDGRRRQIKDETEVTVLSCWECNNKRGALEESQRPLEELHKRAREGKK